LKENFKIINEAEKSDWIHNDTGLLEQIDSSLMLQRPSFVFHDPVAGYMEGFNSQNLHPLISCKYENEDGDELVFKSSMSFFPAGFSLQQSYTNFQSCCDNDQLDLHGSRNVVERLI
jgi:hypothetical protein